ncbi:MAG TPA: O-antigen polymerase [Bacteroidales bacterium]|nr:O-antigen polymerase [Bacteroidales bacterium]
MEFNNTKLPTEKVDGEQKQLYRLLFLGLLTLTSLVLYLFRPMEVSMAYSYCCFAIFLFSTFIYYGYKKKTNYFDFDTLFILLYAVIGFAYSVFIYDENEPYSIAFSLSFDTKFIPTGSILFALGIQFYYWGSIAIRENKLKEKALNLPKIEPINNTALSIIVILLCIAFILSGGVQFYRSIYFYKNTAPETGLILQIMSLLHSFAVTAIATEFFNKLIDKGHRISPVLIISISIVILLMLYAGNRTFSSQLALPIIGLYTMFFKDIGKLKFFIFVLIATVLMWLIQFTRVGVEVESIQKGTELIRDFTIPTRSTYSCMEYIEQYGHTWGRNMTGGLIGVVPSLERVLVTVFGVSPRSLGSAEVLTDFTLGPDPYVGLGTNIIADLFLSFDVFGVILFMFLLGYFINKSQAEAKKLNYYYMIIYASLMSYSVFLVRTTYTHPAKLIVWCLIIGVLNKSISQKLFHKTEC